MNQLMHIFVFFINETAFLSCRVCSHFTLLVFRGSAELLEESGVNISPSESMASIPTCMPFSWFGDKEKEKEREPSCSSSSLPYTAAEPSEQQDRKNKVLQLLSSLSVRACSFVTRQCFSSILVPPPVATNLVQRRLRFGFLKGEGKEAPKIQ